jgi:hypothetical protein
MTSARTTQREQLKEIRTEINRLAYGLQQTLFLQIRDDLDELARSLLREGRPAEVVLATFRPESEMAIRYRLTRVITNKEPAVDDARPNNAREAQNE